MKDTLVERYTYISFDIFDTLLKRSTAKPTDLFRLMEQYGRKHQIPMSQNFADFRIRAERSAAAKAGKPVTLKMIYAEMEQECECPVKDWMDLEIQFELSGCCPNKEYVSLFYQCLKEGKIVVLISDMYLPSEVIGKMLEKCDIRGYQRLYVSCEAGCTKAGGSLYRKVLQDLGIPAHKLLHFGDNRKSDVWIPRFMGIRTCLVPRNKKQFCQNPKTVPPQSTLLCRTIDACIENMSYGMDLYERLGCRTFGPLLAGFTQWLAEQLNQDGICDVYFMSRDGYMMKQAFDAAYPKGFRTHYLYCSRRSYTVPLIWKHSSLPEIFANITIQDKMTLRIFILRLGLELEQCLPYARKCGIDPDKVFEHGTFKTSEKVAAFYESIRSLVIENSKNEYDALLKYITSLHMEKRIAVVDIGRHGTMQNGLEELIREAQLGIDVKGYYVGILPDAPLVNKGIIRASGYLHERGKNEDYVKILGCFVSIFESVFLAQHGSVKRFVSDDGKVKPEMYEFEYENQREKKCDEISIMREYQKGALEFVTGFAEAFPGGLPSVPAGDAWNRFVNMCLHPTLWEAKLWGNFRVFDNVIFLIACPQSLSHYIIYPKDLKKDFMNSPWKIGFMKCLVKLPLPYERIYMAMKHQFHKG